MITLRNLIADGQDNTDQTIMQKNSRMNEILRNNTYMGCQKVKRDDSLEPVLRPWHHDHAGQATFHLLLPHFFQ